MGRRGTGHGSHPKHAIWQHTPPKSMSRPSEQEHADDIRRWKSVTSRADDTAMLSPSLADRSRSTGAESLESIGKEFGLGRMMLNSHQQEQPPYSTQSLSNGGQSHHPYHPSMSTSSSTTTSRSVSGGSGLIASDGYSVETGDDLFNPASAYFATLDSARATTARPSSATKELLSHGVTRDRSLMTHLSQSQKEESDDGMTMDVPNDLGFDLWRANTSRYPDKLDRVLDALLPMNSASTSASGVTEDQSVKRIRMSGEGSTEDGVERPTTDSFGFQELSKTLGDPEIGDTLKAISPRIAMTETQMLPSMSTSFNDERHAPTDLHENGMTTRSALEHTHSVPVDTTMKGRIGSTTTRSGASVLSTSDALPTRGDSVAGQAEPKVTTLEDRIRLKRMLADKRMNADLTQRAGTLWHRLTVPRHSRFLASASDLIGSRGTARFSAYHGPIWTTGHVQIDRLIAGRGDRVCCPESNDPSCCRTCELPVYRRLATFTPSTQSPQRTKYSSDLTWDQPRHPLGFHAGDIVEICGATGTGKSHFCHQLAFFFAATRPFCPDVDPEVYSVDDLKSYGRVIYVDSGSHFSGRKCVDMARAWLSMLHSEQLDEAPSQNPVQDPSGRDKHNREVAFADRSNASQPRTSVPTAQNAAGGASPELYASEPRNVDQFCLDESSHMPRDADRSSVNQSLENGSQTGGLASSTSARRGTKRIFSPVYRHISPRKYASTRHHSTVASTNLFGSANTQSQCQSSQSQSELTQSQAAVQCMAGRPPSEFDDNLAGVLSRIQRYEATNFFQLFTTLAHIRRELEEETNLPVAVGSAQRAKLRLVIIDSIAALLAPLMHCTQVTWPMLVAALGAQLRSLAKDFGIAIVVTNTVITTFAPNVDNYMHLKGADPKVGAQLQRTIANTMVKAPALGATWLGVCDTRLMLEQLPSTVRTKYFQGSMTVVKSKVGPTGSSLHFKIDASGLFPIQL